MKTNTFKLFVTAMVAGCGVVAGCTSDAPVEVENDHGLVEIKLNGGVNAVAASATTKTPIDGMVNGTDTWSGDLLVSFARADEGESSYGDWQANALAGTVKKEKSESNDTHPITFEPSAYYQPNGKKTKLIGWYPQVNADGGDAFDATARTVTFAAATMDGKTDYMVTEPVEGDKATDTQIKSVVFNHLLMQISVKAYTTDEKVLDIWGGIKSVSIKGLQQKCMITLPESTAVLSETAKVAFSDTPTNPTDLPLVKADFKDNSAIDYIKSNPLGVGNATAAKLAGYAMFAPQADKDVILIVETAKGRKQEATVKAPQGGFLAGCSYEVVLKFSGSGIAPTVTIKDWETGATVGEVEL